MDRKLTRAERRTLEWFAQRDEPACRFGSEDPPLIMVRRLCRDGLLQHAGREPAIFGFTYFEISAAGRDALSVGATQ